MAARSPVVSRQPILHMCACAPAAAATHTAAEAAAAPCTASDAHAPSSSSTPPHKLRGGGQGALLAVTDEGLTAFALPGLALRAQAFRTRRANALAWCDAQSVVAVAKAAALGKPARCGA